MSERFLSPNAVSFRLGLAVTTVRQWMREGKLPAFKLPSNEWRMTESQLVRWMKALEKP